MGPSLAMRDHSRTEAGAPSRDAQQFPEVVSRRHVPALDGLRAVAVLTVIFGHRNYPAPGVPADLGVSAFFVLSGFLITRLLMSEEESTGSVSLTRFYARRTLRIFPAYFAFLLFSFALDQLQGYRWSTALSVSAVTYTVNYYNAFLNHPANTISHAWSLAVEEQFYLLWPMCFIVFARRGRRALIMGVTFFAVLALVRRCWVAAHGGSTAYLYNAFDTRFDNLAVGCILAIIADYPAVAAGAERLVRRAWYPLLTVAVLLASRRYMPGHYTVGLTIDAILLAILITQLVQLYSAPLWVWLEHPIAKYLGAISYPMYLYHQWGDAFARHAVSGTSPVFWVGLAGTIALATGSYYVVEQPFRRLRHRFARDRTPITASVARAGYLA